MSQFFFVLSRIFLFFLVCKQMGGLVLGMQDS